MADWTADEARAYLPRLRQLLAIIQSAADLADRARTNGHGSVAGAARSPESPARSKGDASTSSPTTDLGLEPHEALAEIEARGIVLRDLERGLVDFPCTHESGRVVLLCWQLGEDDLEWWHLPEDGFAGRRRLPLPPEL
ncbi:MAG: DUF2203 domain-containing protein [Acidimicrobiales bacterium]